MIVSGIIVRTDGPAALANLAAQLAAEPRLSLGEARGGAQAAVLEFRDADEGEALHDWLLGLAGVRTVDVIHVEYDRAPDATGRETANLPGAQP